MTQVIFFSYSGNSKKIAEIISKELKAEIFEIKTKIKLPYIIWLILSFIPFISFPIKDFEVKGEIIYLCFPKWTFNCPPVTSLIKSKKLAGKVIYLVISYGGWRVESYAESYAKFINKNGGKVKGIFLIRRGEEYKIKDIINK